MYLFLYIFILGYGAAQECPVQIPDSERRDCYPWPGASQSLCEARGCVWCSSATGGIPWCFYNDKVCPSLVPEASRIDCHPEPGVSRDACTSRMCVYCESSTPGIPWCFRDETVSSGGKHCAINADDRVDCWPDPRSENPATEQACLARGCYWCQGIPGSKSPWCHVPRQHGYRVMSQSDTTNGKIATLQRINSPSWFGSDIQTLQVQVTYSKNHRLRIKIIDPAKARFEPPIALSPDDADVTDRMYDVTILEPQFGIRVSRKSGGIIFDTSFYQGFQFSDQFIQFTTILDSGHLYGFGEHVHPTFRHGSNFQRWPMWTRDMDVDLNFHNLYSVQPFYLNVEKSKNAHGVLIMNANAQEVVTMPNGGFQYRTTGGIIDLHFFMGPTPNEVISQYLETTGYPAFPPYWTLGFQISRWGYRNIDHMKEVVQRMRDQNIPHDVQYGDIDYMWDKRDFTVDPVNFAGLKEYVQQMKNDGTRYIIILDPGIALTPPQTPAPGPPTYPPLDRGTAARVWVKDVDNNTDLVGRVWPGSVYYPDFSKPETQAWWTDECVRFKDEIDYAALWIDMNEPSNFDHGVPSPGTCNNNQWNRPPYLPNIANHRLEEKTVCQDTNMYMGMLYNTHSLYGYSMAKQSIVSNRAVHPGKRSIVFSRSTFPGAQKYGQHWLGDNHSKWSNLRHSVIGMLEFNMFGHPYTGADICGFLDPATEPMCQRWQQLGAFYPFSRNHNHKDFPDQDPGVWDSVAKVTRDALNVRYTLLPYLYDLHFLAHTQGLTVVRSLMFEFTADDLTYHINDQFLWGHGLLISPVLDQGVTSINAYFPPAARWFSYYNGQEVSPAGWVRVDAPWDFIPVHVRGGSILPTQQPANSTLFSRRNPMGLIVALNGTGHASGSMFWDDGEALDSVTQSQYLRMTYAVANRELKATIAVNGFNPNLNMDTIRLFGESATVSGVTVNGNTHSSFTQDATTKAIDIANIGVASNTEYTIAWTV